MTELFLTKSKVQLNGSSWGWLLSVVEVYEMIGLVEYAW